MASKKTRNDGDDLRGASRLAVEATKSVTDLVEAMHHAIGGGPDILGRPLAVPVRLITAPVYGSIRAITKLVGVTLDVALEQLQPLLGERTPGPEREAVIAALNGVLGDYLAKTGNPLAIEMRLHHDGHPLTLDEESLREAFSSPVGRKLVVLVHGSSMNDLQWLRQGHDHGAALARDLGYTPVYLHYNSGLHISANGRSLADLLERAVSAWPAPVDELVLLGHSMGGLVSRSACYYGEAANHVWRSKLRKLVCLGSPHHGAPLERGGNWVDVLLGISRYSEALTRLGRIRSCGVTDLRFGNVLDEHWEGADRFAFGKDTRTPLPLPEGVACYAVAATTALDTAASKLPGDGLVPVDSALGRHVKPELTLAFPEAHRSIAYGTGHLDLLDRAEVYRTIASWLASDLST
ncbi:GPI inositol-deacylase [Pendulispora rubella]|uniref:GPI inositol-deacylase n=1 Tax=Pendulispora rubella TaxID=2741070 RepID=A0ABZ2L5R2_9BACT